MAHVLVENIPLLTFEYKPFIEKYWNTGLSGFIIEKYGRINTCDHDEVEKILSSCFEYFVEQFRILIMQQDTEMFFQSVFILHEESIKLYIKQLEGFQLPKDIDSDFPRYRRILKLILEQACDIKLTAKKNIEFQLVLSIIQELYYLGHWIYEFSIHIAYHKMVHNSHCIEFENDIFTCDWQNNYGKINRFLLEYFSLDYKTFFDEEALDELKKALEKNFSIDYNKAMGQISIIKKHFSDRQEQTIEPYILPINLAAECNTSESNASMFYSGLMITRFNKLSIEDAVLKPYSEKRYMFRPILTYIVDDVERALIGDNKMAESIMVIASNTIHWNTMPEEWLQNKEMVKFMSKKGREHDRLLENEIENIFIANKFPYCRNTKSFRQKNKDNVKVDVEGIGEIDFIIVNKDRRKIFIADTKYNRARYDAVGYRTDHTNFLGYEKKIEDKKRWLSTNLQVLQEHLEIIFHIDYSILEFGIEAIFFINTPTFYMFNGRFKAITLIRIKEFIEGNWDYPIIKLKDEANKQYLNYYHPYFSSPPIITQ